jgi:hypothetical protein
MERFFITVPCRSSEEVERREERGWNDTRDEYETY